MTLVQRFSLCLFIIAMAHAAAIVLAVRTPYLALQLAADPPSGSVVFVASDNPDFAGVASGMLLVEATGLSASGVPDTVTLQYLDLIDEPDTLSYEEYETFNARQDRLDAMLRSGPVTFAFEDRDGARRMITAEAASARPLADLPFAFWYQLACAGIISVIGAWVQSLSPRDGKVRRFALAGYGVALAVLTAAIYSTRELAIDGLLFRMLSLLNNIGAMTFGIGMIALFAVYPKDLRIGRLVRALAVFFSVWVVANALQLFPSLSFGTYVGILIEMIAIVVLIIAQYIVTQSDLRARRALTWLGMSVILGAGAFVLLVAVPTIIGLSVALPQGYAFGFFVLIYLGVALGLTRYKLFELDRWAFSVFSYVLAAFLFAAIDFVLISALALTPSLSLGITAIIVGLFYLPVRNVVVQRYAARREPDPFALYRASTEIALRPTDAARAERWRAALADFFQPMNVEERAEGPERAGVAEDGAVLDIPAQPWAPPLRLHHYRKGRGLFGAPHMRMVDQLAVLVAEAEAQRHAYDRGVREERGRIGRDLHDSVGARLLSSLRASDDLDARQMVRHALGDIREIVGGLSDRRETLPNIVAELRAETMERLEESLVDWPLSEADTAEMVLPYTVFRHFTSAHRELISNIIRHAPGAQVTIATSLRDGVLTHRVSNPVLEAGREIRRAFAGNGLANIAVRASDAGGSFAYSLADGRFTAVVSLPVEMVEAAA